MTPSQVPAWPQHLPYEIDIPECNLCWHLVASATRYPSRAALIDERGVMSYSELLHAVERMAGHFQHAFGLAAGERVLLYMPNSREWIIAYYAILYCSAIVVPVNPMYRNAELQPVLKETEPVIAVCSDKGLAEVKLAVAGQTLRGIVGSGQVLSHADNGSAPTPLVHEPDRLALILYSSGSTGVPKGCMHTHRTLNASTVIVAQWMWMAPASIHLVALPFFHITGMQNLLNAPIFSGATLVLMERWSRERAGELIARHHVSHWTAMPTMLIDFLASAQFREFDLSSIRRVGGGGAGMPQAVGERIKEMTGMDFLEGYGLSETAHVTGNPPHAFKRQCLGMPLFNTDVRVIDPESLDELPPGQVGEIVMTGPQVFTGYWRNEDATRAATLLIDGKRFVRSGDLGRRDEEGYFFIVDRLKRMINASGFKVWPAEVESMLHQHPAVAEACVIGISDAYRGESVKAFIVLRTDAPDQTTDVDLIAWARERMAIYKVPRMIVFTDALPKSATGKIAWRELQARERAVNLS